MNREISKEDLIEALSNEMEKLKNKIDITDHINTIHFLKTEQLPEGYNDEDDEKLIWAAKNDLKQLKSDYQYGK